MAIPDDKLYQNGFCAWALIGLSLLVIILVVGFLLGVATARIALP